MKPVCIAILAIICISSVNSQCIIENAGPITLVIFPQQYQDQGTAVVCLHININNTYSNNTFAFRLDVDFFEALVMNGFATWINKQINEKNATQVSVDVQFQNSQNTTIETIEIYNRTTQLYRDVLSFVVITEEGSFSEIRLDNEKCDNLIGSSVCYGGEAYNVIATNGTYPGNDPRFFVSWMGTDVNKNHFISHTRRLSRFSSFSVGSIYNSAKNVITA